MIAQLFSITSNRYGLTDAPVVEEKTLAGCSGSMAVDGGERCGHNRGDKTAIGRWRHAPGSLKEQSRAGRGAGDVSTR